MFKIQMPNSVIRDSEFSSASFYVLAKFIQRFYVQKQSTTTFQLDHKQFMYYAGIKSNQGFKKILNELYERGVIKNKIDTLPRKELLTIEFNAEWCDEQGKPFAQLPYTILSKELLDLIGYQGVRLLFYFRSYIRNTAHHFCFTSQETIATETDMTENTITKYTKILKDNKLIRVSKHVLTATYSYEEDEFNNSKMEFKKYNNHYFLDIEKLKKFK
ncbi:hypothetical protein [Priestia filamentosa]|uniref:hypothetical protein n=1 Tax=Priestia filamentosa TaxID=1402861 RepID=UPI00066283B9|nr:hypothetical protein [Priestia filamentosa]